MAHARSVTTQAIHALLTDEPITIGEIRERLGISIGAALNSINTLLMARDMREVVIKRERGKDLRGFILPRSESKATYERGEYTGEPRPLRYVPRERPAITLGCIGVDRGASTPAGGGEAV